MIKQNKLTVHIKKRETALIWLTAAFTYTALYSVLENPMHSTISMIGRNHIIFFSFYCFLYGVGMILNLNYMRRTFNIRSSFWTTLAYFFNLCMGFVATTVMPLKASGGKETLFATIVHWIFGFGGIIANATLSFVFCLLIYKKIKNKRLVALIWTGSVICVLDLLIFVLLIIITKDIQKSKNGIFEIIPIMVTFAVTYIVNHTDLIVPRKDRDNIEKSLRCDDSSSFTAVAYGLLAFTWIFFTTYSFIRSPIHYTISMIGLEYFGGYVLVCALSAAALVCNFALMFKKSNYKNYFVIALSVISSVSILLCVFQPTTLESNIGLIHSVSAIVFFFGVLGSITFYIIHMSRRNKKYKPFIFIFSGIIIALIITMVMLFVVFKQKYGRTGLAELIPLEAVFIFFCLENHTTYFSEKTAEEVNVVAEAVT